MIESILHVLVCLVQGLLVIALAPLLVGLLHKISARLQLRQGPGVWQPYLDIGKLLARPPVRPAGSSVVFANAPYILLAAYGLLAFTLPIFIPETLVVGDLIFIIAVLGLARFTLSLAGLDSGASFGGLGAGREMFLHFLTEIGLGLLLVALALRWGTTDIITISTEHWRLGLLRFYSEPELVVLGVAFLLLLIFEAERLPVCNPATHLELTMVQQAISLQYAGRDLAIVEWAESIKLITVISLAGQMFFPLPFPGFLSPLASGPAALALAVFSYTLRMGVLLIGLALWEAHEPRRRLRYVPRMALISVALSGVSILYILLLTPAPS